MPKLSAVDRFFAKVDKNGPLPDQSKPHYSGLDKCWSWIGSTVSSGRAGRGVFHFRGRQMMASRVSFAIANGDIPTLWVLHKCDNPNCVNPRHLFLGTHRDNVDDMVSKGRQGKGDRHWAHMHPEWRARGDRHGSKTHPFALPRGESHKHAKLNESDILEIRQRSATGERGRSLAKAFRTSTGNISRIINRIDWAHVA